MKGKLTKRDNQWFVIHIMDDNGIQFGVDYPINPILQMYYFLDEDAEGGEVEFELEVIDNGDNGIRYARLKRQKEQTNRERFEEFMNSLDKYPELEGTNALCTEIINRKKRTGKMTEEEWQAAENNLKPKYTPGKGISFYIAKEISDEEIKEAAKDYHRNNGVYYGQEKTFIDAIKWYREQLKLK